MGIKVIDSRRQILVGIFMKNTLFSFFTQFNLAYQRGYFPDPNLGIKKIVLIAVDRKNNGTANKNEPIKKVKCLLKITVNIYVLESISPEFSHKSFIAGDKRSAQTIPGQLYFINCTARFLQNLSTFLEFPFCTWPRIDGEGPGVK